MQQFSQKETEMMGFDPSVSILSLFKELFNDTCEKQKRQKVGLVIKNKLQKSGLILWRNLPDNDKKNIRVLLIKHLNSPDFIIRQVIAQLISLIATFDVHSSQWISLIDTLLSNIHNFHKSGNKNLQNNATASWNVLSYIFEKNTYNLVLNKLDNIISTAVMCMGNTKNNSLRLSASKAFFSMLDCCEKIISDTKKRNEIMKAMLICTTDIDLKVRKSSLENLVQFAFKYYQYLPQYMNALTDVTIKVIRSDNEEVGMQGIEFWSTLSEVEQEIKEDINNEFKFETIQNNNKKKLKRKMLGLVKLNISKIAPVLIEQLTKQKSDVNNEWNISEASATCFALISKVVGVDILKYVDSYIDSNVNNSDWRRREGSIKLLSAVVDCESSKELNIITTKMLPFLLTFAQKDEKEIVRDTAIFCIGRISKFQIQVITNEFLEDVYKCLTNALSDTPSVCSKASWALTMLSISLENSEDENVYKLFKIYFKKIAQVILKVTEKKSAFESNVAINGFECLSKMISLCKFDMIDGLKKGILPILFTRVVSTLSMKQNEKINSAQSLFVVSISAITKKMGNDLREFSDRIMKLYLTLLSKSQFQSVWEEVFMAIQDIAQEMGSDFKRYLPSFIPFLMKVLKLEMGCKTELLSVAVWLIVDISLATKKSLLVYCDSIMESLLKLCMSSKIERDLKPAIISSFGDISMGIGGEFSRYTKHVASILRQVTRLDITSSDDIEMVEYKNTLRENILDSYCGMINGLKMDNPETFHIFLPDLFVFVKKVYKDKLSDQEVILKACMVCGDVANTFKITDPIKAFLLSPEVSSLVNECSISIDDSTKSAGKFAKSKIQVKVYGGNRHDITPAPGPGNFDFNF